MNGPTARGWSRALVLVLICCSVALLLSVDEVYVELQRVLAVGDRLIAGHPYLGPVVFVLFAAASAMLAFFSSALILPAAVFTWGNPVTLVLLWLGWLLGGVCTYALGRAVRGPRVPGKIAGDVDFYRRRLPAEATFPLVLLLNLALPSEIPGYLCGYLGVRLRTYVAALALAELPYAVGAVLLGEGVVDRHVGLLVLVAAAGAAFSLYALRELHRRLA
jgi:uncharacterized membrane protein YdjX (TVP38/TMEM64 family)